MKKLILIFSVYLIAMTAPAGLYAADNGCGENSGKDFINSNIALCSTHAYNAGLSENPPAGSEDRKNMNDVVALKSTIITQQMKRQYDFLDVTVKRFKTQLEKAILTSKVQAAGGTPDESTSATNTGSNDKSVIIAGAQNCLTQSGATQETLKCVQRNIGLIRNESNINNARKQLNNELDTYRIYNSVGYDTLTAEKDGACKNPSGIQKSYLTKCLNTFNASIGQYLDEYERGSLKKDKAG